MQAHNDVSKRDLAAKSLEILEKVLLSETNLAQLQQTLASRSKDSTGEHITKDQLAYAKKHGTKVTLHGQDFYVSRTLGKIANDLIKYIKTPGADPVEAFQSVYARSAHWLVKQAKAVKHPTTSTEPRQIASSYAVSIQKDKNSLPQHKIYAALHKLSLTLLSIDKYNNPQVFEDFFANINTIVRDLAGARMAQHELNAMLPARQARVSGAPANEKANVEEIPRLHEKIDVNDLTVMPDQDFVVSRLKNDKVAEALKVGKETYNLYNNGKLGAGGFGEVWLAQNKKTGEWLAVKKMFKPDSKTALDEIDSLQKSDQYIFGVQSGGNVYIGMKLQPGQNLHAVIESMKANTSKPLNEAQKLLLAKRILKKAADLHNAKAAIVDPKKKGSTEKMLHRDIKPDNMMMDDQLDVQMIDYGFAAKIQSKDQPIQDDPKGTPLFIGRDVYDPLADKVNYSEKTEVYALGVTLWELYNPEGLQYEYADGFRRPALEVVTREIGQDSLNILIHDMLSDKPKDRPTVNQAYARINAINNKYARENKDEFRVYAIDIDEYREALQDGKLQAYLDEIKASGAEAIAFVGRVRDTLTQEESLAMYRAVKQQGFLQVASKIQFGKDALNLIKAEHNRMFGTTNVVVASSKRAMQAAEAKARTSQTGVFAGRNNANRSSMEIVDPRPAKRGGGCTNRKK